MFVLRLFVKPFKIERSPGVFDLAFHSSLRDYPQIQQFSNIAGVSKVEINSYIYAYASERQFKNYFSRSHLCSWLLTTHLETAKCGLAFKTRISAVEHHSQNHASSTLYLNNNKVRRNAYTKVSVTDLS